MPRRPLLPRVALAQIGLGALVQTAACLDFDGLAGGAAPSSDGGADVSEQVDAFADAGGPDAPPPRGIVLRGAAQAGPIEGAMPLVLPLPPGVQPGDLMVLALASSSSSAVFTTDAGAAGWVPRFKVTPQCEPDAGSPTTGTFTVQSKLATSDEDSTLSVTFDVSSSTKDRAAAILSVWGGVDPTAPIDTEIFAATHDLVAPGLATTAPNAQLTAFFVNAKAGGSAWTAPAGMTARASTGFVALFDEPLGAPGPTGPRAAATTATEICGAVAMLALRPSP